MGDIVDVGNGADRETDDDAPGNEGISPTRSSMGKPERAYRPNRASQKPGNRSTALARAQGVLLVAGEMNYRSADSIQEADDEH